MTLCNLRVPNSIVKMFDSISFTFAFGIPKKNALQSCNNCVSSVDIDIERMAAGAPKNTFTDYFCQVTQGETACDCINEGAPSALLACGALHSKKHLFLFANCTLSNIFALILFLIESGLTPLPLFA